MPKPKGGRGQRAPYQTKLMRVPVPLEQQINELVERYQDYLDSEGEVDVDNPPQLFEGEQNNFIDLCASLDKLINKINAMETGYKSNSFSQGIKDIKQILIQACNR